MQVRSPRRAGGTPEATGGKALTAAAAGDSLLLTDLYQLTMADAYLHAGVTETASFELFVRHLPGRRGFLMAAGLEPALAFLEQARFAPAELDWLRRTQGLGKATLDWLSDFHFAGDVHAMPEGTVFFPDEPILRVTAPMPMAQLVESRLMNILHFQTLVASKAARMRLAAPGRQLIDFGLRRAHGAEAGLMAARAAYLAGFDATATTLAGALWGAPVSGTMAHSFIQAFDDEAAAFEAFARARPHDVTLLIDTYDVADAARKVVALARRLRDDDVRIAAVRLDSGDLVAQSKMVRRILDEGGAGEIRIFASGGLDEDDLFVFIRTGAPIDGFGLGTSLGASTDAPALDCAYKLVAYAGIPRRKVSEGKETWPGAKQVWRRYDASGRMRRDMVSSTDDVQEGEPLLRPVMRKGQRVDPLGLEVTRRRAAFELSRLPEPLGRLERFDYPVEFSPRLKRLAQEVDRRREAPAGGTVIGQDGGARPPGPLI